MLDESTFDFISLANRLADASGPIIRNYFRTPFKVDQKGDGSPVTLADKDAETIIRSILAGERPMDGIFGEEYKTSNLDAEFIWVIDPIDGTKSFITGRPIFGTLIALVQKNEPILGLIDQPINKERWLSARGEGATFNGEVIRVRACPTLTDAVIGTTSPELFNTTGQNQWREVAARAKHVIYGGDCYTYAQLATGFVDVVMESGLKPYDFCAIAVLVEEAGGVVTDWHGNPVTLKSDGSILACGDPRVHREVMDFIRK